jgi:predicted O-linked N-acetylglucosamine transferase (SPINDLY family)
VTTQQTILAAAQLQQTGRSAELETLCRKFLSEHSREDNALDALGKLATRGGLSRLAAELFTAAAKANPKSPEHPANLGLALLGDRRFAESAEASRRAIRLGANLPPPYNNLGIALHHLNQPEEAIAAFETAIRIQPKYFRAMSNLGELLADVGRVPEAIAMLRRAVAAGPDYYPAFSNLLRILLYSADTDARTILDESRVWNRRFAASLREERGYSNDRQPDRKLRIGYVSPDFRVHSVSRFLLPLLRNHDHERFEIFCYADLRKSDSVTEEFRACADGWRATLGQADERVTDTIRRDGIDILLDLAGHTGGGRLGVFARKPAPIQISYLGYAATTGLETIDYRFTDALADPPGVTDAFCTEKLLRLARTNWCYDPPADAPAAGAPPCTLGHPLCFGCFNAFVKITPMMFDLWARILSAHESSRIYLKSIGLSAPSVRQRIVREFVSRGIGAERLIVAGFMDNPREHYAAYTRVDIALDTFPYHGTTTTCDALWMGVPVITLAGSAHVSRVGASLLHQVGLDELVADSPERYVELAKNLATDVARLTELRATLRQRMSASPLMDGPGFARDVEAAYREVWRAWCAG